MKKPGPIWIGAKKTLSRAVAIEQYIVLRMRVDELKRLDYLLKAMKNNRLTLPADAPFSSIELADVVRTCFFGWVATLTDRDGRAVYPFDCLCSLFPHKKAEIIKPQSALEACHAELQEFRNNVAFHSRTEVKAHISARTKLRGDDIFLDLTSGITDFLHLMERLEGEELEAIPELPSVLQQMRVSHLPAFKGVHAMGASVAGAAARH